MSREMKDSGIEWIGEIPEEWDIKVAFQIFTQVKNKNSELKEKNLLSLSYGKIKRKNIDTVGGLLPESFDGYNIIDANDIVLRLTDLQNDHTSLRVGLSTEGGIITSAYLTLRNQGKNYPTYLYYYLHSFDLCKGFYGMGAGVRQGLNWDGIKLLKIALPPLSEQEKIATFLDSECARIDEVISKTKSTIDEYKKLKQSVITEAVTKGIRPNREMKDSGIEWIGDIPKEWEVRKLFRAIDCIGDIDHYMPNSSEAGIPYLMTGDLKDKLSKVNFNDCKLVSVEDYQMLSSKIKATKGDVIFARYATIGTVCLVDIDKDFLVSYSCLTIKPTINLLIGKYLFYYFKSNTFFEEIKQYINSNTQSNIGLDSMTKSKVVIPTISEQEEIANYLDEKCTEIDTLIAKKEQIVSELESYKKSLIYEYVTGKKEVV